MMVQADVNARDKYWRTPFHVAAAQGAVACVELLEPKIGNINITDRAGRSGLHHACYAGRTSMVSRIIDLSNICMNLSGEISSGEGSKCERLGQEGEETFALGCTPGL